MVWPTPFQTEYKEYTDMASNKQTIQLLKDKRPTSCFIDQIYDPDKDGPWSDDESFPRVIPAEGAIAIDRESHVIYVVTYVDPVTYKSTIAPITTMAEHDSSSGNDSNVIKVLSYGNDRFTLFVNKDHKPTQLTISSNFVVFGHDLVKYQLYRYAKDGTREVISIYLDSDEEYRGEYIPLLPVMENSPVKQCTNCHTLHELEDGDTINMDIFDTTGVLRVTIRLVVVNETSINDLSSEADMIIGLDATALQMLDDGTFFLYQKQDVSHLGVIPRLKYHDGRYLDLPVDDKSTFIYGLEGFNPAFVGQRQRIIIKHFLGPKEVSNITQTTGTSRYVTCEKWVTVLPNEIMDAVKVSAMPIWNAAENNWYLKFVAYSDKRDKVYDATPYIKRVADVDTSLFGIPQRLRIEMDLSELFGASATLTYSQTVYFKFFHKNEFQRYLISDDSKMDTVYGVEAAGTIRRPIIFYDKNLSKYYVPTSRFRNSQAFLDAFYFKASPPVDDVIELTPPVPTHFTIRALDNLTTLVTAPISIDTYNVAWMINRTGNPAMLVGANVIVEFLKETSGGTFQILYGVPVDVHESTTPEGYVGEQQPLE